MFKKMEQKGAATSIDVNRPALLKVVENRVAARTAVLVVYGPHYDARRADGHPSVIHFSRA
jgi:hypothetical protein